jgi:hypothetical protein
MFELLLLLEHLSKVAVLAMWILVLLWKSKVFQLWKSLQQCLWELMSVLQKRVRLLFQGSWLELRMAVQWLP